MHSNKHKTFFQWSTGKDAAFAFNELLQNPDYEVEKLLTTISQSLGRVSMHGLRKELLEAQIAQMNVPSQIVALPENADMTTYDAIMQQTFQGLKREGFTHAAFGDIFLEDLKNYREAQLQKTGIKALFPIWKRNTNDLLREMLDKGFQMIVICINADLLDSSFCGQVIDEYFIKSLPSHIDPCGERGEYHTFCFQAPFFRAPVAFSIGEKVNRTYPPMQGQSKGVDFCFCDLLPINS